MGHPVQKGYLQFNFFTQLESNWTDFNGQVVKVLSDQILSGL